MYRSLHNMMKSSNKLQGKVALITGGTSGLGLATARRFVAEGGQVFVTGRRQDAVDAAVKDIGGTITGVQGDVAKLADLDRLYDINSRKSGPPRHPVCQCGRGS